MDNFHAIPDSKINRPSQNSYQPNSNQVEFPFQNPSMNNIFNNNGHPNNQLRNTFNNNNSINNFDQNGINGHFLNNNVNNNAYPPYSERAPSFSPQDGNIYQQQQIPTDRSNNLNYPLNFNQIPISPIGPGPSNMSGTDTARSFQPENN